MTVLSRTLLSSRYGRAGVAVALAVAGGLVYLLRGQIASNYATAQETVVAALGLGIVPVAVWLTAFASALVVRRSWFWRANLWVGSLASVALILGVMAFFEASTGALAAFTRRGEVSLGGSVGDTIVGPTAWVGVLRLSGIFGIGALIVTPTLTLRSAAAFGRGLVYLYIVSMLALRGLVAGLKHMYRFDPQSRFRRRTAAVDGVGHLDQSGDLPDAPVASPRGVPASRARDFEAALPAATSQHRPTAISRRQTSQSSTVRSGMSGAAVESPSARPAQSRAPAELEVKERPGTVRWVKLTPEGEPDAVEVAGPENPPPRRKFNKFWSSRPEELTTAIAQTPEDPATDEADDGPLLDTTPASWELPPRDLLVAAAEAGISEKEMAKTAETIRKTLAEYNVEVEIGDVKPGPTVTMYGLVPGWVRRHKQVKVTDEHGQLKLDESGKPTIARVETKTRVKVDSLMSREKDLALALKTPSIRIETPVLGKSLVGIEVPNPTPELVTLRSAVESEEFNRLRQSAELPIALGKGTDGESVVVDLTSMPHLLIAGATGSGKSVCINTIVSCLIMERTPAQVRLLLVDPKRVELTPYNKIPHLLTPVVVETDQVVALLKGMIREMLKRYRLLEEVGVRNIGSYNQKMPEKMPYLVVAIDELADLMMSASFEVEQSLCRLAQLGRATGIHLIVATQRPSVDVVTGLIKANFPSRVSFGVTSQVDSRTILDSVGAEKLLGRGDMLYLAVDGSRPERVQGVYISDPEIEEIVNFWQTTPWAPLSHVSLHTPADEEIDDDLQADGSGDRDELLDQAKDLADRYKKLSTSLLQRRLRIGYPRAARLMDQLEEAGIVGPGDGSKSRDVIMNKM